MLADGVDLADRRARAQQRPGHLLLLRKGYAGDRRDPVGGAAAGQQHQQQIVGTGAGGELQALLRALQSGLVGHGMAGLDHLDPPRRHAMAVARGRDPRKPRGVEAERVEIMPLRRRRHGGRGLAGGKADHAALRRGRRCAASTTSGCAAATAASKIARRRGRLSVMLHGTSAAGDRRKHATPVIHPIAQKKTPARCRGGFRCERRRRRREASRRRRRRRCRRTAPTARP